MVAAQARPTATEAGEVSALVIGIAMIMSMIIASICGAMVPIVLKAVGQDPATSSSIVLTTFTDCGGFLSFLGLATLLSSLLTPG